MDDDERIEARKHVMPGDPPGLGTIALRWYTGYDFGQPHTTRESNIAVEAFKDGYRAALSPSLLHGRDEVAQRASRLLDKAGGWHFSVSSGCDITYRQTALAAIEAAIRGEE